VGSKFHISKFLVDHYNKTKALKQKISGFYMFTRPILMITDLEVVKAIMVKDFNIFPNRGLYFNEKDDPISAHMFNVENEQWRTLRQKLSPTFTSGKLKMMFSTIDDVSVKLMETLNKEAESGVVEIKDILARFTTDVIGSAAFGLDCNSLENRNSKFYEMGTKIFNSPSAVLKRTLRNSYRNLARKLKIKLLPEDVAHFYLSITKETVSYRESNPNIKRHDFMNLLVEMKKENIVTVEQIAAQSFVFFLAGYETSSSTMTYCMYEFAINEEIQEKARESVMEVLKRHNDQFTYESVNEMNYLEQCVNETLRKYPVISSLQRAAIKEYEIPSTGIKIQKGQSVWIPVYAIHYDEEIYPQPETFNPNRFTQEEVAKRHPMAFLPFGEGPRK
jgi:cytochrome P450 family 6